MDDTKAHSNQTGHFADETLDRFTLSSFFPYQVRVFYRSVSDAISDVYTDRFGLTVSEWRTMAVLGPHGAKSASEIVAQSSMDKVIVSRAIKGLQAHGLLKRDIDGDDRRRAVLRLTAEGRNLFGHLVPLVKQVEEECLHGLSEGERVMLKSLMERVRINAEELSSRSNTGENAANDG